MRKKLFFILFLIFTLIFLLFSFSCSYMAFEGLEEMFSKKAIVSFNFDRSLNPDLSSDVSGCISGNTIYLTVPYGTNLNALKPSINIIGSAVSPGSNQERSFSADSVYTVKAEDGTTISYSVVVIEASGDSKEILSFAFSDLLNGSINSDVYGTITDNTIDLVLPAGTPLATFTPTIAVSGVSINPGSQDPVDFSAPPVAYTVTAVNGTIKTYYVNVIVSTDVIAPTVSTPALTSGAVSQTAAQLNWNKAADDVSDQGNLHYKLLRSLSPITTITAAQDLTGDDIVTDWTADITTGTAAGLTPDTWYYFNVLVRDSAGNMTLYSQLYVQTLSNAVAPSIPNETITAASVLQSTISLSWNDASDDDTPIGELQYKLVRSALPITTIAEAQAISAPDIVMNWTQDTNNATANSMSAGTWYYFNVLVRDNSGNMSLYTQLYVQTQTNPGVPSIPDNTITTTSVTQSTISLSWNDANDDDTPLWELQYKLVRSTSPITTIAEAQAITAPDIILDWIQDTNSATAHSMPQDTWYYFTVLVKDNSSNIALYALHREKTFMDFNTNLIAEYILNNEDYTDTSGNGFTLAEAGSLSTTNNRVPAASSAAYFGTGTNHLYRTSSAEFNPGNELTISLWIQLSNVSADQKIIGKVNTSKNRGYVLGVRNDNIYIEVWDEIGIRYSLDEPGNSVPIITGSWVHLAMSWETDGMLRAYVGGELVGEISTGSNPIGTNGDNFVIGACPWPSGGTLMVEDGAIDDIRIYSDVLTPYEIYHLATLAAD